MITLEDCWRDYCAEVLDPSIPPGAMLVMGPFLRRVFFAGAVSTVDLRAGGVPMRALTDELNRFLAEPPEHMQ